MSRCQRKIVAGVTISRNPAKRPTGSVPASDFEWLVYSSHESSIAVAGWLADFFRAKWSDWGSVAYGGPFHTIDRRGSWEMPKP
jgi:hypothetical protein